ncbi:MAG: hypothetical protein OEZ43_21670 [Gammaproteobacteria bacterium]|nr:hypothetical protein [Gammaproteobacteria bacterium]
MFSRIGFILLLFGLVNSVSAEIFEHSVESFQTGQGIVAKKQFGEPEDFGNRAVRIFLDDKLLYEEKDYPFVYLNGFFTIGDSTLIIISVTDGGNACPAFYKIIDVKNRSDIVVTKEFGTCSDLIQAIPEDNRLKITMPSMHPSDSEGSWEYYERKLVDKKTTEPSNKKLNALYYNKDEHDTITGKIALVTRDLKAGQTKITLHLKDKLILEEQNFKLGFIKYYYPRDSKAKFVVISLGDKKDGCNARFRIIEFDKKGVKHMSPEFGNCGAYASFGYKNGGVRASFMKSSKKPYEEYLFKNGQITQIK